MWKWDGFEENMNGFAFPKKMHRFGETEKENPGQMANPGLAGKLLSKQYVCVSHLVCHSFSCGRLDVRQGCSLGRELRIKTFFWNVPVSSQSQRLTVLVLSRLCDLTSRGRPWCWDMNSFGFSWMAGSVTNRGGNW